MDPPLSLLSNARKSGKIYEDDMGKPWFDDGNIFLFTNDRAFQFYLGLLKDNAPQLKRLHDLSDDSVDIIQKHPAIELDDSSEDLSYFLSATCEDSGREFPLESDKNFIALSAILRLATKYGAKRMRENAIQTLQRKFPSTLLDWDLLAENATLHWTSDPISVINLAREVSAFTVMPAAMAFLTNDASAGEVFGIQVHEGTRLRTPPRTLKAPEDIRGFALMKEYNHYSVVTLINFVYGLGKDCQQPPELEPRPSGMAPVGARRHEHRASICSKVFGGFADMLAMKLKREDLMGYRQFSKLVWQEGMSQELPICRQCRLHFKNGCQYHQEKWWNNIPHILGLP